jgi:hypothetical protein
LLQSTTCFSPLVSLFLSTGTTEMGLGDGPSQVRCTQLDVTVTSTMMLCKQGEGMAGQDRTEQVKKVAYIGSTYCSGNGGGEAAQGCHARLRQEL